MEEIKPGQTITPGSNNDAPPTPSTDQETTVNNAPEQPVKQITADTVHAPTEEQTVSPQPPSPRFVDNGNKQPEQIQNSLPELFNWQASEFIQHQRNVGWYIMLAVGTLGIAGALVLLFGEWLSAGVVVLMAVTVGVYAVRKPRVLNYLLNEAGIKIGEKFYSYNSFYSFAVVSDRSFYTIELDPIRRFMPRINIYFDQQDGDKIVDILEEHLPRDERKQEWIDRLSRKLKF